MDFVVVAIGVFAIAEVLASIDAGDKARMLPVPKGLRNLLPSWEELKACRFAFLNGSITGFIIGVLPGAGSTISSFIAYGIEKAVSKHPEKFGQGAPEGVAAPEGANNADSGGALVPLLTLGIPGGGTTAIMLSALVLWGVRPGPLLMTESPDVFWGLVASMYIGNVVLLILNLPHGAGVRADPAAAGARPVPDHPRASRWSAPTACPAGCSTSGCWSASACSATSW